MTEQKANWGLGTDPAIYGNPHNVDPSADLPFEPHFDIPTWGETRFVSAFCPASGAGIYFHGGRHRADLNMWWAHIAAFLPNGEVVVDRSSGRIDEPLGMSTGNFSIRIDEPLRHFTIDFDGAGQIMTNEQLARGAGGSGARYVPMQWSIAGDAVAPVWDIFALPSVGHTTFGSVHTQQAFQTYGQITVAGETFNLDGVGVNDHSCGPRDLSTFGHHWWLIAVFRGMSIHTQKIWRPDGSFMLYAGSIFTTDGVVNLVDMDMPVFGNLLGAPHQFQLVLKRADGSDFKLHVEILHTLPVTVTEGNDNINGVDWDGGTDPFVATECLARFTTEDGQVGYGHVERSKKRSRIERI